MDDSHKGRFFGYAQLLDEERVEALPVQQAALMAEYEVRYQHNYRWGGIYADERGCRNILLAKRPAGGKLNVELSYGDLVVVESFKRGFRSARDLAVMLTQWKSKGVRLVVMESDLDTSNTAGQMVVTILGQINDWEHIRIAELKSAATVARRKAGKPIAGRRPPLGFQYVGAIGDRRLVGDPKQRKLMDWMMAKFHDGWTPNQIRWQLNNDGVLSYEKKAWSTFMVETHLCAHAIIFAFEKDRGIDLSDKTPPVELIEALRQERKGQKKQE